MSHYGMPSQSSQELFHLYVFVSEMVKWLALRTLNPAIRVQVCEMVP